MTGCPFPAHCTYPYGPQCDDCAALWRSTEDTERDVPLFIPTPDGARLNPEAEDVLIRLMEEESDD